MKVKMQSSHGWYGKKSPCLNAMEKDTWSLVFMDFRPTNPYKIHVWYIYHTFG